MTGLPILLGLLMRLSIARENSLTRHTSDTAFSHFASHSRVALPVILVLPSWKTIFLQRLEVGVSMPLLRCGEW